VENVIQFFKLTPPSEGERIVRDQDGVLAVPDNPIIPFMNGDGVGAEIMAATQLVVDEAMKKAFDETKKISWFQIYAGSEAKDLYDEYLPQDTTAAIQYYLIGIKGPLTTPTGGGIRSLNYTFRNTFDLYACIRPCFYIPGTPSPARYPEHMNIVIFRENTEDVYNGIEWDASSDDARKLRAFMKDELGIDISDDAGIGLKEISESKTKRLVRVAIKHAIENDLPSVTIMHKGNIMKYTEGNFNKWAYEVASEEFGDKTITEKEVREKLGGHPPEGMIVMKDRIADNMLYQVLIQPEEYSVIVAPNLNGDYLSDVCASQIGGLGMAPSANIGDDYAMFEAAHGTAPDIAGQNMANPTSLILSACMMLEYIKWPEAAAIIKNAIMGTIKKGFLTSDLARLMKGSTSLSTTDYAQKIVENM